MDSAVDAPDAVAQTVMNDLRNRLLAYRRVDLPTGFGWQGGVDGDYLARLIDYWIDHYDWREHERRIRSWPWRLTRHGSDIPIRVVHQRSPRPTATAVLLLHGWPDSILRFERVMPMLTDVHVVA